MVPEVYGPEWADRFQCWAHRLSTYVAELRWFVAHRKCRNQRAAADRLRAPDHFSSSIGSGSVASSTTSSFATSASVSRSCRCWLFPKRIHGVNPRCSIAVSVNTCSGDRAPSGIRSLPAWAFPSSQPSSRTGGRPRPRSWSLPRCACASCCTGGGGSRLPPIAKKPQCSTQPSTSWTERLAVGVSGVATRVPWPARRDRVRVGYPAPTSELNGSSVITTGVWWTATLKRHVTFESSCERDHLITLDFDPDVVGAAALAQKAGT
jgi:hypothetical protein